MPKRRVSSGNKIKSDRNGSPPAGSHLTLYEALMLQMIVARIVEAYEHEAKERS